jgi:MFS family permease
MLKGVLFFSFLQESLFFATQACTILHWSRLSDNIGRKPVVLIGLFGVSLSMYCFALSRTFWGLVFRCDQKFVRKNIHTKEFFSRALNGALNGNTGVFKSIIAEMTDHTNLALAYSYMPLAWGIGGTLG